MKLALLAILALPLAAQTGLPLDQLRAPVTALPMMIACLPPGSGLPARCIPVPIGAGLEMDTVTGEIRASAPATTRDRTEIIKPSASLPTHTLGQPPVTMTLVVVRNGLEQSEGEDYAISGRVVTFVSMSTPRAGDLVKFRYRW